MGVSKGVGDAACAGLAGADVVASVALVGIGALIDVGLRVNSAMMNDWVTCNEGSLVFKT